VTLSPDAVQARFSVSDIAADISLAGAVQYLLYRMAARGDVFSLRIEYWTAASAWYRQELIYTPSSGFRPVVDPALYDDVWLTDITPSGRALVAGYKDDQPQVNYIDYIDYLVVDGPELTLIARDREVSLVRQSYGFPDALALNDRGNVLFQRRASSDSNVREGLALTGALPEARCIAPPTAIAPSPSATPTETPTPSHTPTVTPTLPPDCAVEPNACALAGHVDPRRAGRARRDRSNTAQQAPGLWRLRTDRGYARSAGCTGTGEAAAVSSGNRQPDSRSALQPVGCRDDCGHATSVPWCWHCTISTRFRTGRRSSPVS
jgi:hypothetical protein